MTEQLIGDDNQAEIKLAPYYRCFQLKTSLLSRSAVAVLHITDLSYFLLNNVKDEDKIDGQFS